MRPKRKITLVPRFNAWKAIVNELFFYENFVLYWEGQGALPPFHNIFNTLGSKSSKLEYQATRVFVNRKVIMIHMAGRPHLGRPF